MEETVRVQSPTVQHGRPDGTHEVKSAIVHKLAEKALKGKALDCRTVSVLPVKRFTVLWVVQLTTPFRPRFPTSSSPLPPKGFRASRETFTSVYHQ
jgi:hypothetical protein